MADDKTYGLPTAILSSIETLAQSVAGVAPSAAPAMTVAIVFGMAGNGTWLTYVISTAIVVTTALCINLYAERSSSPGSLYAYATEGGGKLAGFAAGWSLLAAYVLCTAVCGIQFAIFFNALLADTGFTPLQPLNLLILCLIFVWMIGYRNVKLSAEMMLWLEIISLTIISGLLIHSTWRAGSIIDPHQLSLDGATTHGVATGLVMAILAYVGFESASSLGDEAENPLKRIPQAIILSVLLAGAFFVFSSYTLVLGFESIPEQPLANCATPLIVLARHNGLPWLGTLTNLGAAISFFACCLALSNAAARIGLTMSIDGLLHKSLQSVHPKNHTPDVGLTLVIIAAFVISAGLLNCGHPLIDVVGWLGTIGTYHCIIAYVIVSALVPAYMNRLRLFKPRHLVLPVLACASMIGAFVGTVIPTPAAPYCWLPYLSLVYMAIGILYFVWRKKAVAQNFNTTDPG